MNELSVVVNDFKTRNKKTKKTCMKANILIGFMNTKYIQYSY